ncbi:class I SAM-dependent methyltransferase [Candidatus Pelagibacter sp.]|nr:class I SAM-dependent methyltransferase [Candidatus Pelagibacter sp.]
MKSKTYDENIRSLSNQYNQYIYPKPCENIDKEWIENNRFQLCDPNYLWHKIWPEKKYSRKSLKVLVAGCGSDQVAILARCNPIHQFIGIDLSKNSLAHQKKLIEKHNINNVELIHDDFRKITFKDKFDYIICSGVIHHLDDINTALDYFKNNLKDVGAIFLMIYGDQQSAGINGIKKVFKNLNFSHNQESIENIRKILFKLKDQHPAKIFSNLYTDMNNDAGIVDTFMHPKENFSNIKNFLNTLEKNDLIIKNFVDSRIAPITKYFVDNKILLEKIRSMNVKDRLELAQILNWNDRKINLICTHTKNIKYSYLYNEIMLDKIYLFKTVNISYQLSNKTLKIIDKENNSNFQLNDLNENIDWKTLLNGQKSLSEITKNLKNDERKNLYKNIHFLLENYVLDYSFFKIEDYNKYYTK